MARVRTWHLTTIAAVMGLVATGLQIWGSIQTSWEQAKNEKLFTSQVEQCYRDGGHWWRGECRPGQ